MAGGLYSRLNTRPTGGTISGPNDDAEWDNIISNSLPAKFDDYSANTGQMNSTKDPYPASVQALATSLAEELEHIRYVLVQILGETNWYNDVDGSLAGVYTNAATFAGKKTFSNNVITSKGADVASATALPIITDGNYFDVTGTTTVTSIDTVGIGFQMTLHFDGALILTHHATDLILPSAANITTVAGDEATFVEYAAGDWRCINYSRADGSAVTPTTITGILGTWDATPAKDTDIGPTSTDLIVCVYFQSAGTANHLVEGRTDSNSTPTTVRIKYENAGIGGGQFGAFTFPVKKGDYYKVQDVTTGATVTINAIPLGS